MEFVLATAVSSERLLTVRRGFPPEICEQRVAATEDGSSQWLIAIEGGKVMGWVVIEWNGKATKPTHPDIADLFVPDHLRREGVGTALMREAERRVIERGATEVGLSVNPTENRAAHRLYERLGYRHDGEPSYLDGVYDGHEDWVIDMVKQLT